MFYLARSMYKFFNPNPERQLVGDCVVRAISKLQEIPWQTAYLHVCSQGYRMFDMPSSNRVWGEYLKHKGYKRYVLPDSCPECYTVRDFCDDNPRGRYLLATGTHVCAVVDGDYYDTWDSGDETPIYYWRKD